ncbi:hypothetical protein Taro_043715 [Colocasia esculenta]|uniref:Uncharacterized protein n=1 Tax=Colocasia esculenta TaxID=4460 RepID=A0A843X180_COLES|nr:hypothetical protein [Colocasia esculenta]
MQMQQGRRAPFWGVFLHFWCSRATTHDPNNRYSRPIALRQRTRRVPAPQSPDLALPPPICHSRASTPADGRRRMAGAPTVTAPPPVISAEDHRGIIDSQSIEMSYMLDLHGQLLQEQILNILCTMSEKMQKEHVQEVQFKRPPQFQVLFDETHKKKGTNDYISKKAREVEESYSRGMDERYGDDSQRPELDPDIWVAASGAPKKGHVYGFGHSLGTTRVISSCSSSFSHATSPFTTPAAPGGSSSAAPTITPDMFRAIVNETISQTISTIISQTVSQMLTELGIPGNRAPLAPPAQQPPDHLSRDVGRDDDQDDTYAEDL